jgi:hypothetical protein
MRNADLSTTIALGAAYLCMSAWGCSDAARPTRTTTTTSTQTTTTTTTTAPTTTPTTTASEGCGNAVGAWSPVVDGLRGRVVRSDASADRSALSIFVELENVGDAPRSIHWDGRPSLGYATFHLDDAAGVEVPRPDWGFGGNEMAGSLYETVSVSGVVRHEIPNTLTTMNGERALRIGAFWGRELPSDGSRRYLRATVVGRAPQPDDSQVRFGEGDEGATVGAAPTEPPGRAWTSSLELPGVCID